MVPCAMDCFLANRGLKTLPLRMEKHSQNAMKIANFLEKHGKVSLVLYSGLESHPQYELAKKQTPRGFSGMVTFKVKSNDPKATTKFVSSCKLFRLAVSLGGVDSLCEIPFFMSRDSQPQEESRLLGIGENLVRLSIGVEDVDDLISDLDQALNQIDQ